MPRSKIQKTSSPYNAVDSSWKKMDGKGLDHVYPRVFLGQTLAGMLPSVFEAAQQSEVRHGFAFVPEKLAENSAGWPTGSTPLGSGLLIAIPDTKRLWRVLESKIASSNNALKELWIAWTGRNGCLVLVARRMAAKRRFSFSLQDLWQVAFSWEIEAVERAVEVLKVECSQDVEVVEQLKGMDRDLETLKKRSVVSNLPTVRTTLALADNVDPWTQRRLVESQWVSVMHRIQDSVSGELRSERLLPAIGNILKGTVSYDFIEIHVFTRVGKRYEEFISWRRNFTGYGDDKMSILLSEKLVASILKEKHSRLIRTERVDGVMNPHLVQLAGLQEGLIVPLVYGRRVQGLMMLFYRRQLNFNPHDMERVEKIAKVIARAIEASNAHTKVHRMATMDALTNISNRRLFNEQIKKEFKRAKRYGHRLALIMIDIDNFKHYNDTHGHLQGDKLLQQLAQVLHANVREEDTVARYGGEEFAIILPENDIRNGHLVAEKIRNAVLDTPFPKGDQQPMGKMTISLGVADNSRAIKTPRELINHADLALYHAKETGRNRTVMYTPELDSAA